LRVILAGSDIIFDDQLGSVGRKKAGTRLFRESLLTDKFTKIEQNRTLMAIICPLFHLRLGPRHLEDLRFKPRLGEDKIQHRTHNEGC